MAQTVKIISVEHLTHDVLQIVADKPRGLSFKPGQAVDVCISEQGWEQQLRAFTFTSLPYEQLLSLGAGKGLLGHGVFGDIEYKGEGGFIAGGAGVTPFAILQELEKNNQIRNNKLIFANKTKADIIWEDKYRKLLGDNLSTYFVTRNTLNTNTAILQQSL